MMREERWKLFGLQNQTTTREKYFWKNFLRPGDNVEFLVRLRGGRCLESIVAKVKTMICWAEPN